MPKADLLRDSWASLGVNFTKMSAKDFSPEEALIMLVQSNEFPEDKKMMSLALGWLKNYSTLVHVERLKNMSKDLSPFEMALLGGIASKCVANGDFRWKKIESLALARSKKYKRDFPGDDDFLLNTKGKDKEFSKYKVFVATIDTENEKKFYRRERIVSQNKWLKLRVLFGANLRADVATVLCLGLASTAYAAAKYLYCSQSAVYRNWQDLKDVHWEQLSEHI